MSRRNVIVSGAVAVLFVATAGALAVFVPSQRSPSLWAVAAIVVAYAVASRVEFEFGAGSAVPTEIVLVPMLFLLPLGQVPLWVARRAICSEKRPRYLRRRAHVEKSLDPPLLFVACRRPGARAAVAGERPPQWGDAPIYLAALLRPVRVRRWKLRCCATGWCTTIPIATLTRYLGMGLTRRSCTRPGRPADRVRGRPGVGGDRAHAAPDRLHLDVRARTAALA